LDSDATRPLLMPRDNQGVASALTYPPKPARGDSATILSPSGRSPSRFPAPFELGLRRLREKFDLVPVDTQQRARRVLWPQSAREIHVVFADPAIKAVLASIGGEDELKVLARTHRAAVRHPERRGCDRRQRTPAHRSHLLTSDVRKRLGGSGPERHGVECG
jgi:hypothetical protein